VKWLLRFLLWATPLTWLATTFYPQYVQFLSGVVIRLFAIAGIDMHLTSLDVLAPIDLVLFTALALSTFTTPWPRRLARLGMGLGILFLVELVVVVTGVWLFLMARVPLESPVRVLFQNTVSLIGWAGAPIVWFLLFEPRQLLRANASTTATSRARATSGSRAL
jgi:hypothetical protein